MKYQILKPFLKKEDLFTQNEFKINPFLLENNKTQVEQLYDFYNGDVDLLYVNGFLGTGKAEIVDYSTSFVSEETIILKYNCFNSTVLDDVLLAFFKEFKRLTALNIISEPKIKTESFAQKINSYFSQIEKPFLIIIDSFEAILGENKQEICDFVLHLNSMSKVKIIIIGRSFDAKPFKDIKIARITTLALERNLFDKYLKAEKLKTNSAMSDELFKYTRGYYFYTSITIRILQKQNIEIVEFLKRLKESFLSFSEFLEKETLCLIPENQKNLFWFLSILRNSVSVDLLKKIEFYQEEGFSQLFENKMLIQENNEIYVQDYFDDLVETAPAYIIQKIHEFAIELYQSQLPLKPMERNICISRQTMRKEIEFHKLFLPKKNIGFDNRNVDIDYLSYSKVFNSPAKEMISNKLDRLEKMVENESGIDITQRKNVSLNLSNFSFPAENELKPQPQAYERPQPQKEVANKEPNTLKDFIALIKQAEDIYDYATVAELSTKALLLKTDIDYDKSKTFLYSKAANANEKIAKHDKALFYLNLLQKLYEEKQDFEQVNTVKLKISTIYFETYRFKEAQKGFEEIANDPRTSDDNKVKAYLKLANIESEQSPQKAFKYFELAIKSSKYIEDDAILAELYFNYALIMDDKNDIKSAIEYYTKCSEITSKNKFLSSAYSNLASLALENNQQPQAIDYYKKALETDIKDNNVDGVYDASSKLANLLKRKQPLEALEYFNTALDYAEKTKDVFYIVTSALAIGDFYYETKKDDFALKYYKKALKVAQNNLTQDNISKINVRINDLKFRMGNENFERQSAIIDKELNYGK